MVDTLSGRTGLSCALPKAKAHDLRIAVPSLDEFAVDDDQRSALAAAVDAVREAGAEVAEIAPPPFDEACEVKWAISSPEAAAANRKLIEGREGDLQPTVRRLLENGAAVRVVDYIEALLRRRELCSEYAAALAGFDALFCPTVPTAAPVSAAVGEAELVGMTRFTSLFNVVGAPAVAVPAGLNALGLPLSIQIAGRTGGDAGVLRAAAVYQRAAGHAVLRPPAQQVSKND